MTFRSSRLGTLGLLACALPACRERSLPPASVESSSTRTDASSSEGAGGSAAAWQPFTLAPHAIDDFPAGFAPGSTARFDVACRINDGALVRVAERLAAGAVRAPVAIDSERLNFMLRAEGSPYLWARAWWLEGRELTAQDIGERLKRWLGSFDDAGERRCGIARRRAADGREVIAVVAVDAAADLRPTPTRVRPGQWVNIQSSLLVPASDAKVVVVGPDAVPHGVPTSFAGGEVRARFNADRPGTWRAQLLATTAAGPRPLLEVVTHAGVDPPGAPERGPVPGDAALAAGLEASDALASMLNRARASMGLDRLWQSAALDRLAREHAEAMREARRLAHDTGRGDATIRARVALADVVVGGENIAHAATLRDAHRTLWESPSHRSNMLNGRFGAVGIGVARDEDGSLWVCELFAIQTRREPAVGHELETY
ncbi:MAG TPA: CAP domain-containing protein [Polyangiaceae bacterium]